MLYSPHARCASISELRKMVTKNTDCVALRLSRKLGTSSRRDDCARRTCDTETKMRSTERKFLPPEKISSVVHGAAVGERTESERREDENDRARVPIIERAKCICRLYVLSARGVFANVRALRTFVLLLKGETLQLIKISREKRSLRFGRFLSLESLLFLQRFCLPGGERERESVGCAL